jgi:hypothetical protein
VTPARQPYRPRTRSALGMGDRAFTLPQKDGPSSPLGRRFAAELAVLDVDDDLVEFEETPRRPRTRGECAAAERPCPWVSCRHHMAVDVLDTGSLKINSTLDLAELPATCSLDVADEGLHTLEEVAVVWNLTRERVRQIQQTAIESMRAGLGRKWIRHDDLPFITDRTNPET